MNALALQKCLNHPAREAVARCTACAQPYCRECVVEHEDRLLCAACLRKATGRQGFRAGWIQKALAGAHLAASIFFLWIYFFAFGRILLSIPASFHEGEVWKKLGDTMFLSQ
jgi:hypothetical protein